MQLPKRGIVVLVVLVVVVVVVGGVSRLSSIDGYGPIEPAMAAPRTNLPCLERAASLMLRGDSVVHEALPLLSKLDPREFEMTWFEYPPRPDQSVAVPHVQLHTMAVHSEEEHQEEEEEKEGVSSQSSPSTSSSTSSSSSSFLAVAASASKHKRLQKQRATPINGTPEGGQVLAQWMAAFRAHPRDGLAQCDGLVCEMGPIAFASQAMKDPTAMTTFPVPIPTRFRDGFSNVEARLQQMEEGVVSPPVRESALAAAQRRAPHPVVPANETLMVTSSMMMTIVERDAENRLRQVADSEMQELASRPLSRLWPGSSLILHFAYYGADNPGHAMMVWPSMFKIITGLCYPIDRVFAPLWQTSPEKFPFGVKLIDMFVYQMLHRCGRSVAVVSARGYDGTIGEKDKHVHVVENAVVLDLVASSWLGRQVMPMPWDPTVRAKRYHELGLMHDLDVWRYDAATGLAMTSAIYCMQGIPLDTPYWQRTGHPPEIASNPCAKVTSVGQARREQGLVVVVQRGLHASRHIVNIPEVEAKLGAAARRLGLRLVVVNPGEVNVNEFVALMSRAAMVIALHGGVMGNAVFCRANAVWVEVFQRHLFAIRGREMMRVVVGSGMVYSPFVVTEADSVVLMPPPFNTSRPMPGAGGLPFTSMLTMEDPEVMCPGAAYRCRLNIQYASNIRLPVDRLVKHVEPLLEAATHPCASAPALWGGDSRRRVLRGNSGSGSE